MSMIRDLAALAALASIGTGLWWWSPSLSLVATGGLVLAGIVAGQIRSEQKPKRER
ncbi:MAG TPA: hypothetical protein VF175_03140 [Lacipirellula sp.]